MGVAGRGPLKCHQLQEATGEDPCPSLHTRIESCVFLGPRRHSESLSVGWPRPGGARLSVRGSGPAAPTDEALVPTPPTSLCSCFSVRPGRSGHVRPSAWHPEGGLCLRCPAGHAHTVPAK